MEWIPKGHARPPITALQFVQGAHDHHQGKMDLEEPYRQICRDAGRLFAATKKPSLVRSQDLFMPGQLSAPLPKQQVADH